MTLIALLITAAIILFVIGIPLSILVAVHEDERTAFFIGMVVTIAVILMYSGLTTLCWFVAKGVLA